MAGEMHPSELQPGGDWYEAGQSLLQAAQALCRMREWWMWTVLGAAATLALAWVWAHCSHQVQTRDLMIRSERLRKLLERSFHGKH